MSLVLNNWAQIYMYFVYLVRRRCLFVCFFVFFCSFPNSPKKSRSLSSKMDDSELQIRRDNRANLGIISHIFQ